MDQERARQQLIALYAEIVTNETARGRSDTLARARAAGVFVGLLALLAEDDSRNWHTIKQHMDRIRARKSR